MEEKTQITKPANNIPISLDNKKTKQSKIPISLDNNKTNKTKYLSALITTKQTKQNTDQPW